MFEDSFIIFIVLGFIAQLIDGALGMAFGVFLTTVLTFIGIPVAQASASVHFSEIFTTLISGISHFKFKNVDMGLFKRLAFFGVIGGIIGAYVLSAVDGNIIRPFVSIYLLILGVCLLFKSFSRYRPKRMKKHVIPLGLFGGFFDAVGGGGWGPIVTSTLIARGNSPRKSIGTVNFSEFFVTVAQSATFFIVIGLTSWKMVVGLIMGGVIAAPLAAYTCRKVNVKILILFVAVIIIITNILSLVKYSFS